MNKNEVLSFTNKVFEYVMTLEEEQIKAFLEGDLEFELVKKEVEEVIAEEEIQEEEVILSEPAKELTDTEYLIEKLNEVATVDDAYSILGNKNITVKILKQVAGDMNIQIGKKAKKDEIKTKLVEEIVIARLKL